MQKAFIILFIFFSQIISGHLFAQRSLQGVVQDSLGFPLKSVNVRLIADSDTSSISTNALGEFSFSSIKSNYVLLTYSMLGYKTESSSHYYIDDQKKLKIPIIKLKSFNHILASVNVIRVLPMIMNNDTIQFNFGAFDFRQNSLLEDALRELPGFQVYRDGSVSYNGRAVRRVRVDNKDFFGGDVLTATRNLPADFIQNIQLIDASDAYQGSTGILKEEEDKILNINLKEDKKRIYFGQATVGSGSNDRYLGSFGVNKFDRGQEISLIGSFNNTNTSVFTFGSPLGAVREFGLLEMGAMGEPIDGLNKVNSLGFNLTDQISKVINFSGSYNYLYQSNLTDGNSQLTSSYIGNTIFRKEDYVINTEDRNHRVRFGFDMKFKNQDIFKINGNFSFNQQFSENNKDMRINNYQSSSFGNYQDSSRKSSPNGDLEFLYSKFFSKKGRKLLGSLTVNSNNNNRSDFVRERYFENDGLHSSINTEFEQNQFIFQKNHTNESRLSFTYIEPFSETSLLELSYEYDVTVIDALRNVEDRLLDSENRFVDSLSVDYVYNFSSHKGSMVYQYEPNKKFKMNIGFAVQPLVMKGSLALTNVDYNYENVNLIPTANFIYKFSKDMDWQLNYKGKNNQPYFNQIAPVIDNSNSRNVIIGNPELKSEYGHRIATTFRKSRAAYMQYFEVNLAYNFVLNKIVSDKKTLASSTIQETSFQNASGYYDWRLYYTFNTPFITDNLQLDFTGTSDYYNNLSFIDGGKRTTNQLLVNQSMQLKYTWSDYFESLLNANYLWNQARYDIPFRTTIDVKTMFLGLGLKGYVNDNWSIGMDMSQRFNDGYKNNVLNINQTMMNSFIEFSFLRNKSAVLRLQAYDIFDQNKNSGIISEYIGNDVFEARNNRLGRYFMLSLSLRLQKLPK